jgi:hypothetical protein
MREERSVQRSRRDDLLSELLAEVHAIEADIQAAQDAAAQIDALRAQVEAARQDAAAVLRTPEAATLSPDDARRVRETALARLQDQRTQLADAEQVRSEAADRVLHAAHRLTAARRLLEQLTVTDETT